MAVFDESKVINVFHKDKAVVGKKYYFSEFLYNLKSRVEDEDVNCVGELTYVNDRCDPFQKDTNNYWEFIYPYEEPPKQRMTKCQFIEWLAKGNGVWKYYDGNIVSNTMSYDERRFDEDVGEDKLIRPWDSDEWIEPTVDIYERDCVEPYLAKESVK